MANHVYVAERASGFNFTVILEDAEGKETRRRVRFEKGQFKTDDDELAAAIDWALEHTPNLARFCRKTDRAAAEALAKQHAAMLARQGAVKGGVTAEAAKHAMDTSLAERDLQLRSQHVDGQAFAESDLMLTEQTGAKPAKPTGIKLGSK